MCPPARSIHLVELDIDPGSARMGLLLYHVNGTATRIGHRNLARVLRNTRNLSHEWRSDERLGVKRTESWDGIIVHLRAIMGRESGFRPAVADDRLKREI
jgi:hypothetical protein